MTIFGSRRSDRSARAPGVRRRAVVGVIALLPVLAVLGTVAPAGAGNGNGGGGGGNGNGGGGATHKSYVCKYVGTPGVDERLKDGKNPIWVDNHALTGKDDSVVQVGDTFSDAQEKSVVILANVPRMPEPTVDQCPAPVGPTKVTATAPTVTAPTCEADGKLIVPADTASITYASDPAGTGPGVYTVTATAKPGYVIDGVSTWDITVLPMLTGAACPTSVTPMQPTVVPSSLCDVEGSYTIPATTGIDYLLGTTVIAAGTHPGPASGTVTAQAKTGYTLSTTNWSYPLSLPAAAACPKAAVVLVTPVNPTVVPSKTCEVQGKYTIPATTGVTYLLGGKVVAAGTYKGPASGTVTAQAKAGYALSTTTWSYALTLPAAAICPAAVEAPTETVTPTGTTVPAETAAVAEPTTALPKTGAPTPLLAGAGALALLLGLAMLAIGSRRPRADLS